MLSFGVTALPDPPYTRLVEVLQNAEKQGFEYGWTYDSHILWQESYALLAIAATQTQKIKLGHCVTNPGIRDPTITASWYATMQDVSNGRDGDGHRPRRLLAPGGRAQAGQGGRVRAPAGMIKDLMNGRQVDWNDKELELEWVRDELPDIPMHVAGYGPRALGVAGRVGDGVIIQLADPQIIQWIMATAREAAEEAGRDPDALQCIVCAPSHVSDDLAEAREQVRWFPAMVSNHVMDLIERYGADSDEIPSGADRLRQGAEVLRLQGPQPRRRKARRVRHRRDLRPLLRARQHRAGHREAARARVGIGVDQFDIYLMTEGADETLAAYGSDVIPQFTGVAA